MDRDIKEVALEMNDALEMVYGAREAGAMTWIILEHLTGYRPGLPLNGESKVLPGDKRDSLQEIIDRVLDGEPLQYVLGETEFYGLRLRVTPDVLIPRQETEELVDLILKSNAAFEWKSGPGPSVLDIGTGSGCIAIALKKNLALTTGSQVWACDVSVKALDIARENARLNLANVLFKPADILDRNSWKQFPVYDIIVSNPPYVTVSEQRSMARNVVEHEPHLALFVEDEDPLIFYREIARFARQKLRAGGTVYFEINEAYGYQVLDLLEQAGFRHTILRKDLNGKDRMISARQD